MMMDYSSTVSTCPSRKNRLVLLEALEVLDSLALRLVLMVGGMASTFAAVVAGDAGGATLFSELRLRKVDGRRSEV
jgi:hypothetical protein